MDLDGTFPTGTSGTEFATAFATDPDSRCPGESFGGNTAGDSSSLHDSISGIEGNSRAQLATAVADGDRPDADPTHLSQ